MKYTLLELTQAVLSSMDSDEISSIGDTVESQQVVEVIKTVYDDIISRSDLVKNKTLFNLTGSSDPTKQIVMTKPTNIEKIDWLIYDCRTADMTIPAWKDLEYLPPDNFIQMMHAYNPAEPSVSQFDHLVNGFTIRFAYKNDQAPRFYSTFDDDMVFFNAYDAAVDASLQASKSIGFGQKINTFVKQDTYVPELPGHLFPLLLNESKSLAWVELKQAEHPKAEAAARKNWLHLQKTRLNIPSDAEFNKNKSFDSLPNFSRK